CASANRRVADGTGRGRSGAVTSITFTPSPSVTNAYRNCTATARGLTTSGAPTTAATRGLSGSSRLTITRPLSASTYAYVPAIVRLTAPSSNPSGLNVAARSRKLFVGSPSTTVATRVRFLLPGGLPTTTSPSYLSVTYRNA